MPMAVALPFILCVWFHVACGSNTRYAGSRGDAVVKERAR